MYGNRNSGETPVSSQVIDAKVIETNGNQAEEQSRIANMLTTRNFKRAAVAVLAASGIGAGVAFANKGSEGGNVPMPTESHEAAYLASSAKHDANCNDGEIKYSVFPGHPTELLPSDAKVTSKDQAGNYNRSLFKKGNLGNDIDPAAVATIYALIGGPASSTSTDNGSTIYNTFSNAYDQIVGNGGDTKAARYFCEVDESVTSQTFGYNASAIAPNVPYTQVSASVGGNGHIDNITFKQHTSHSETVGGVTYEVQNGNTDNKLSGFTEVIIPTNGHGVIDILGLLPNAGTSNQQKNKGTSGTTESKNGPSGEKNNQNTSSSSNSSNKSNNGSSSSKTTTPSKGGSSPTETSVPTGGAGSGAEGSQSGQSGTGTSGTGGNGGGKGSTTTTSNTSPNKAPSTTTTVGTVESTTTTTVPPQTTTTTSPPTTTTTSPPTTTTTTSPNKDPNPNPGGCTDPFDPSCQS